VLPIDPGADIGRRAWIRCPRCRDHEGCDDCAAGRTCTVHWRYLLANRGRVLYLQCPSCAHLWEHETPVGGDAA
jgi:hypothetical protein